MQAFSFLHCADLHLGAPFQGLVDVPADLARVLRDAPARALDRIVATALERRVAAVIMAGDVFDAADRNLLPQIRLRDGLRKLDAAGIPTFIAAGNHDPLGSAVASIEYPASVHCFGETVEAVPLMRGAEPLAHIYGVSHSGPAVADNLARQFPDAPKGPFSIAVVHANVGGRAEHERYAPCTLADLETRRFDYWALGHVHKRETLRDQPPVVHYPGNAQGLHMRELGPRGATLVEVSLAGSVSLSPVWTDTVRWHRARTSIEQLDSLDDAMGAFAEVVSRTAAEAPDRLHIVLWTLTGSGPMHGTLRRDEVVADLVHALRYQHAPEPRAGAVWLQRLDVETRPRRDIGELRKQQDLLGDLLRLAQEMRDRAPMPRPGEVGKDLDISAPDPIANAIREELAVLLDDARLRAVLHDDPWQTLDWQRLLRRAEVLAIEGLLGEDTEQ
ncbi:MAG: DNA repair exonuclease [Acidobacteriota bacterium]|jgi:DNA repair exonuclease SbcCD nuclease subunit